MKYKNTAANATAALDAITESLQPAIGCPHPVTKCRRPPSRLYEESLDLEDDLRYSLPSYAVRYLDKALEGDIDAADSLLWSAPNSRRGDIAVLFYLRGSSAILQRRILGGAWIGNHEEVIAAARSSTRLKAMFKRMRFELPSFIPEQVELWRGIHKYGRFGVSWTLRRDVGLWFARRVRLRNGEPLVLSTVVPRDNILFYDDQREEAECVIFDTGKISYYELDTFDENEGVRQSAFCLSEQS